MSPRRTAAILRIGAALLTIGLAACGSTATRQADSTTRPITSPAGVDLPVCNAPITAIFAIQVTSANGVAGDSVFCLNVKSDTDLTSRLLERPTQFRQVLAANSQILVEVDGGSVDGSNELGIFDLASGTSRVLGNLASFDIGDPGPMGGVLSPDGSQLAIGAAHKLLLIAMPSGQSRTLAAVTADRWLMPLRWTAAGIIARKVGYEGMGDFGLMVVDPAAGTFSMLNQGPNNQLAISPNGKFLAVTTHVDLGDRPTVRYPWQNALDLVGQDGSQTRIISEANHWFTPLDVRDDGQVLFSSDSQTDPVAPDMGVYLAQGGHSAQQVTSTFSGEWGGAAQFLDSSRAFLAHIRGGLGDKETSVDLELYHLCSTTATSCTANRITVITIPGTWPTVVTSIIVFPTGGLP